MKKALILILVLCLGCESQNNKNNSDNKNQNKKELESQKKSRNLKKLLSYTYLYNPKSVTFKLNDSLKKYDLVYLFTNIKDDLEIKDEISKILLLKLSKYQYRTAQQSYNIYNNLGECCSEDAQSVIKYYLKRNNIDTVAVDVLTLGELLDVELKKENSTYVLNLMKEIDSILDENLGEYEKSMKNN